MDPKIGLTDSRRRAVTDILDALLADEYVLYTKTRNYHWNVTGSHFGELHKFFEAQYEQLDDFVDDVAERARALGGFALGTLQELKAAARVKEQPGKHPAARDMLANLLSDHEALVRQLRADVAVCDDKHGDAGTADFLTGLMEQHEKMAWMLRSYLEG